MKDITNPHAVGIPPDHLVRERSEHRPDRQQQPVPAQVAHRAACALQLPEFGEDEIQTRLNFLIGIEDHGARSVISEPRRKRQAQFAACRFLPLPLMQAHTDLVEFCLTHDAGQTQQQAVVIGTRVVQTFAISDEHAEYRAKFEQLMPVPIVAGQTRRVETDHQAGVAETDLGN